MQFNDLLHRQDNLQISSSFYLSFSDLMLLLCVFFVMIVGISDIKIGSFEQIKTGFQGNDTGTLVALAKELKEESAKLENVTVDLTPEGVRIDLPSVALFETSSAIIKANNLQPIAPMLKRILNTKYMIDVEGHTDDLRLYQPLKTNQGIEVQTNWTLSGRRASSVVQYLNNFGIHNNRLRIVGYASTRPKISTLNKKGDHLEKARAHNRRVSLLVH